MEYSELLSPIFESQQRATRASCSFITTKRNSQLEDKMHRIDERNNIVDSEFELCHKKEHLSICIRPITRRKLTENNNYLDEHSTMVIIKVDKKQN